MKARNGTEQIAPRPWLVTADAGRKDGKGVLKQHAAEAEAAASQFVNLNIVLYN